jgi:hypothetical protein
MLSKDRYKELIYIGISGRVKKDGSLFIRKGGMKDRMINGHQFGEEPRKISRNYTFIGMSRTMINSRIALGF